MAELNQRQEMFCREYIKDLNGTQAAIRAGYSPRTADRMAYELLKKPEIQEFVLQSKAERVEEVKVDANYVLKRLIEIDEMDVADILDDGGDFLPIRKWPKTWRTTLSGLDIAIINSGDTETILKKIKWPDKVKNLELIGKHVDVNAFKERLEVSGTVTIADRMAAARRRVKEQAGGEE